MDEQADDIVDSDQLWRRIRPEWIVKTSPDELTVSSAAFLDGHTGRVSVHVARLTEQKYVLELRPSDGLAQLEARFPRGLGHTVAFEHEPGDPSHAVICPPSGQAGKHTKRDARLMARQACLLVVPSFIKHS